MAPDSSTPNPLLMEEIPATVDQLTEKVGKLFHCMKGPPMAYFHIPLTDRRNEGPHIPTGEREDLVERLVYESLRFATRDTEGAEARLVMAMLEPFIDARRQLFDRCKDDTALLFWRVPLEIAEGPNKYKLLRCRVVIPGASLARYEVKEGDGMRWV